MTAAADSSVFTETYRIHVPPVDTQKITGLMETKKNAYVPAFSMLASI
jgi:hypothetical protein